MAVFTNKKYPELKIFEIGLTGDRQKVENFPLEYMTIYVKPIYVAQVYIDFFL
jgi:hypothetical protein